MKRFASSLSVAVLLGTVGCASSGWQAVDVPLPRSTPYDSNQFARNAYLEGFRGGYRAQQNADRSVSLIGGPYQDAQIHGFRAGAALARSEMPGEVAPASPAEIMR
jgi:hypothetical protein